MKRREMLAIAAVSVAASTVGGAAEQSTQHQHDTGGSRLAESALQCVKTGNA